MSRALKILLRGDAAEIAQWLNAPGWRNLFACCAAIVAGCGLFGASVGLWRAPLQGLFTGIKFPLLIFLTAGGNALLNGLLAQLLGSGLSFRQTSFAILFSFALAALFLAAMTPLTLFILFNTPPLASTKSVVGHSVMLLTEVLLIAYAGVVANHRLLRLLERSSGSETTARRVLFSWLAGNLFLGSQLAWVLRPFIGSPQIAVQFLRDDPLRGNFFEAVANAFRHLLL